MIDVELTEQIKGNGSITIKKQCPNCSAEMFFVVKENTVIMIDGVCKWESVRNQIIKCENCDAKYKWAIKST